MDYPDKDKISERLLTASLGRNIVCVDETPSTNTLAKELALQGAKEGTLVICANQTHGRGRGGRKWVSDEGSLCMSIITRPDIQPKYISRYTLAFAVAAVRSFRCFGIDCAIKWPNDILFNERKLCGILCECGYPKDKNSYLVCGIGVNVNNRFKGANESYLCHRPEDDDDFAKRAVSMSDIAGHDFVRERVAAKILNEAEFMFGKCTTDEGFRRILNEYGTYFCMTGREVIVYTDDKEVCGTVHGLDLHGWIVVKTKYGSCAFDSADVSVRVIDK